MTGRTACPRRALPAHRRRADDLPRRRTQGHAARPAVAEPTPSRSTCRASPRNRHRRRAAADAGQSRPRTAAERNADARRRTARPLLDVLELLDLACTSATRSSWPPDPARSLRETRTMEHGRRPADLLRAKAGSCSNRWSPRCSACGQEERHHRNHRRHLPRRPHHQGLGRPVRPGRIVEFTHVAESVLDEVRDGKLPMRRGDGRRCCCPAATTSAH